MLQNARVAIVLVILVALQNSACTMWGEKKHNSWKTVTAGEELTRLYWEEVKQKDWKELGDHLAPMVVALGAQGTYDREAMLAHMKRMDIAAFQIGDVKTSPAGETLVVTYTLAVRGTMDGQPLPPTVRFMHVWQLLKGGWVLVAQSAVPAA